MKTVRVCIMIPAAFLVAGIGYSSPAPTTAPAPATQPTAADGIRIKDLLLEQALFGSGSRLADVTDRVALLLLSEPQGFTAQADWLRTDPVPGKNKSLLIRYRYRDQEHLFMVTGNNRASYAALLEGPDAPPQ